MSNQMQCMEVWGGNRSADQHFHMPDLDVWRAIRHYILEFSARMIATTSRHNSFHPLLSFGFAMRVAVVIMAS